MAKEKDTTVRRNASPFPPDMLKKLQEHDLPEQEKEERLTQVLDRLLGELLITSDLVDDLRGRAFGEGESKSDGMVKEAGNINLESQAKCAANRAASINIRLKAALLRL